jgi:hypothetical protein
MTYHLLGCDLLDRLLSVFGIALLFRASYSKGFATIF